MATEKGDRVADPSPSTSRQSLFENLAEVTNNMHSGSAGTNTGNRKDLLSNEVMCSEYESDEESPPGVDPTVQVILAEQARQADALQSIEAVLTKLSGAINLGRGGNSREGTRTAEPIKDGGAHTTGQDETNSADPLDSLVKQCIDNSQIQDDNAEETEDNIISDFETFFGKKKASGPPVRNDLAATIKDGLAGVPDMTNLGKLLELYPKPENIDTLMAPRVPVEVWKLVKPPTRHRDARLQFSQQLLAQSIVPVLRMVEQLMEAVIQKKSPDAGQLLGLARDATKMLVGAHTDINEKRREALKADLNGEYKQMCSGTIVTTDSLLGDDCVKKLKALHETKDLVTKISNSNRQGGKYRPKPYNIPHVPRQQYFHQSNPHYAHKKGGYSKGNQYNRGHHNSERSGPAQGSTFLGQHPRGPKMGPKRF